MFEEPKNPEILIGDMKLLDFLATTHAQETAVHPLQELLEQIIEEDLTDDERELFYLRFGESLSYREIAKRMNYKSHRTFQIQINRIKKKVRQGLERSGIEFDSDSHN